MVFLIEESQQKGDLCILILALSCCLYVCLFFCLGVSCFFIVVFVVNCFNWFPKKILQRIWLWMEVQWLWCPIVPEVYMVTRVLEKVDSSFPNSQVFILKKKKKSKTMTTNYTFLFWEDCPLPHTPSLHLKEFLWENCSFLWLPQEPSSREHICSWKEWLTGRMSAEYQVSSPLSSQGLRSSQPLALALTSRPDSILHLLN